VNSVTVRVTETLTYQRTFDLAEIAEDTGLSIDQVAALADDELIEHLWASTSLSDRLYRHGDIDDSRAEVLRSNDQNLWMVLGLVT